jgi:predicted DNA-binding antitoxin AbrB/MazE fold protein
MMTLTVEATYENGILKLVEPLPLKEHGVAAVEISHTAPPANHPVLHAAWKL